jgi:signal peptidase I
MSDTNSAAKSKTDESWAELAKTVVYAGLIAIVIRTFLFQPFNIPTGSMENSAPLAC